MVSQREMERSDIRPIRVETRLSSHYQKRRLQNFNDEVLEGRGKHLTPCVISAIRTSSSMVR